MKYTNKHKRALPHWHKVKHPHAVLTGSNGWTWNVPTDDEKLKQWCQQQSSQGRFTFKETYWYFEFLEDATWFALNHG